MRDKTHKRLHRFLVRFFSVATLVLIPVAVAAGLMANRLFSAAKQEVMASVERDARLVATQELWVFSGIRNTLLGVSEFAEVKSRNIRDCSKTMVVLLEHINTPIKQFLNLGVADFNGNIVCSALPLTGPVNIADRDYFQRAVATRDFSFGKYQVGRVTGEPTLNFGYPVISSVGSVDAVVFAALDLNALNDAVARLDLPGNVSLAITDDDNRVLVAFPRADGLIGKTWGGDVLSRLPVSDDGSMEGSDVYGTPGIMGVSKIALPNQSSHLQVIVGMSLGAIFKDVSFSQFFGTVLFLASAAIAAVCGWFLSGKIIEHLPSEA